MAEKVFSAVTNNTSRRIDIVFDTYPDVSIKNAERSKRSARSESGDIRIFSLDIQLSLGASFLQFRPTEQKW